MAAGDLVDPALNDLDRGELISIPSLHYIGHWQAFEAKRQAMLGLLSNTSRPVPAPRYAKR